MSEYAVDIGGRPAAPGIWQWLFDPFTYVAGGRALALGLAAMLLAGLIGSFSYTHFDGVLDLHTGRPAATWVFLSEGLINWLSLAVVLFVFGKLASKSAFRARDLFGTQAMARWPMLIGAVAALAPPYRRFAAAVAENPMNIMRGTGVAVFDMVVAVLAMIVIVVMLVWMVALMYRSYRICCNLKGGTAVATFVVGLFIAEGLSKVAVLWQVVRAGGV